MGYKETLKTPRLVLRPLSQDDCDAVQSWAGNPANVVYMSYGPNTPQDTAAFLQTTKPGIDFGVELAENGGLIGSCGIYPDKEDYWAEVGWILHMDHWMKGYGTELAAELVRYGFEDLGLGRIQANCVAGNYGSRRLMERSGMSREALKRKAFKLRGTGEWVDKLEYAILAEDYRERHAG